MAPAMAVALALTVGGAVAAAGTVTVRPSNMQGWGFLQETPIGSGMIESGPGGPGSLGAGSVNLIVDSTGGEIIGKAAYQGVRLDTVTQLEYSTHRTLGTPALAIALQFNIDPDLNVTKDVNNDSIEDFQGRLVYEPYYTHPVLTGVWQRWNTQDNAGLGNWWFTGSPQNNALTGCSMANPCTWAELLTKFPDAGVHTVFGAVILKAGGGWVGGFDGNTDWLTIGVSGDVTTFDFEPNLPVPTNKDQCKKGGWQNHARADGSTFKNQGDCIQYVNTGK